MSARPVTRTLFALVLAPSLVGLGYVLGRHAAGRSVPSAAARLSKEAFPATGAFTRSQPSPRHTDSADAPPADDQQRGALAPCPATEEQMCERLGQLAATDPAAALRLADSAATPRQRVLFRAAVLRGWAGQDSLAAADWALANVRVEERRAAVEELALGAVARPDVAMQTFRHLIAADPSLAGDHGNALVHALARTGHYDDASEFAAAAPAEHRAAWLATVFNQWAVYEPRTAFTALDKIPASDARREARDSLLAGWAMSDPATLVAFAETLPTSTTKTEALKGGLEQWVRLSPGEASTWMEKFEPGPDFDAGAAALATLPGIVRQKPEIAASWAESIADPVLRASTLLDLIRLWGERDAAAAGHYAATSPALLSEQRQLALAALQPFP